MVIIRESPKKQRSTADQQWPPRSPLDALLSSPSGRKRYESRAQRDSVSPSPAKRRRIESHVELGSGYRNGIGITVSDDEDEDEEVLSLKLQAIEAKLKLKKLQKAKGKASASSVDGSDPPTSRPGTAASLGRNDIQDKSVIQVPLSPIRATRVLEPTSPARILLGIDKGLRAQDVSLKRASSSRGAGIDRSAATQSLHVARSSSLHHHTDSRGNKSANQPKSFTERILESRTGQKEHIAKQTRINSARSQGFGIARSNGQESISSSQTLASKNSARKGPVEADLNSAAGSATASLANNGIRSGSENRARTNAGEEAILEPYSGFHVRDRRTDHNTLTRMFSGKAIYSIPQLLKEVVSPDYDPPDCESDYVVLGIVASKSAPLEHKNRFPKVVHGAGSEESTRTKFMVMHLTDLKWELDLFLFDTGFETFWKLTPGTVVAILNPAIMPPRDKATGAFSLKLASSEDTILEIGSAADLGFCKAVKANGSECLAWVDARKTEFCEYHVSLKVEKARKGRMEFNTMFGGSTVSSKGKGSGSSMHGGKSKFGKNGLKQEGRTYDPAIHETVYLAPRELGFNATRLLDDNDADVNAWQRGCSREEWDRKKKKEQDKEAELARKLGELGSGAGKAYLSARKVDAAGKPTHAGYRITATTSAMSHSSSASTLVVPPSDAQSLGLLGKRAQDVSFTPAGTKRKRGLGSGSASEPMGWGGAGKRGLLLEPPKAADSSLPSKCIIKQPGQISPRKNARLMVEGKGIRIPGRESLGDAVEAGRREMEQDSDDELEIV